jgi:hypothetical protein
MPGASSPALSPVLSATEASPAVPDAKLQNLKQFLPLAGCLFHANMLILQNEVGKQLQ